MDDQQTHPNPCTGKGFPTLPEPSDPLALSNRLSLPFPHEAAAILGVERGARGVISEELVAQAQKRMYLMASMMGVWNRHDDPPAAA